MKTNMKYLSLLLLAATACGDNKEAPDARVRPDADKTFPAAPTLGTQIDRMGRPAVNTLLNHGFDPTAEAGSAKDKYNADTGSGSGWVATWRGEFAKSAAIIDSLDTGFCGNGTCEVGEYGTGVVTPPPNTVLCAADCKGVAEVGSGAACGNTVLYNAGVPNPNPGTPLPPNPGSYVALGSLLAQDELFLNTSKGQCALYLAIEYYVSLSMPDLETTCGGRKLDYDVVDFSLSMLSAGTGGFDVAGGFIPKIGDGVSKHTDYLADFPYLGNPH